MKAARGQISVFLALIFLLVASLIAVTLESGHAAGTDALMQRAASSAIESVFAAFDSDLLGDFGLMAARGRNGSFLSWTNDAERYARAYLQPAGGLVREGDRLGLDALTIKASDSVFITEDNGRIFVDSVMDYMKSAGMGILLKETLERLGLFDEDGAQSFSGTLQSFLGSDSYSLEDILGNYSDLKDKAEELIQAAAEAGADEDESPGEEAGQSAGDLSGFSFSSLLDELRTIRENGLLSFFTAQQEISAFSWSEPDRPSQLTEAEISVHSGTAEADFSFDEVLLLGEYMMNKMSCLTEQVKGVRRYEAEYVISGKKSDREALSSVTADLMLIRTGLNFAYLCTDAEKLAAAEAAAAAVMSLLALPELTAVLKWLIVAAWAAAEAVADVRALCQGKRVVLWKSSASWKLSAISLEGAEESGFSVGLSYRDYLRLLFYLKAGPQAAYRMMDVIQARLRTYGSSFCLREYMVKASLSMTAVMTTMYLQYPAFRRLSGAGFGRQYTKTAAYAY